MSNPLPNGDNQIVLLLLLVRCFVAIVGSLLILVLILRTPRPFTDRKQWRVLVVSQLVNSFGLYVEDCIIEWWS